MLKIRNILSISKIFRSIVVLCATNLFPIFDKILCIVLFKYFLGDKEHFQEHLSTQHMFLIDGNVFLVFQKQLLCMGSKTDICYGLGTYFS